MQCTVPLPNHEQKHLPTILLNNYIVSLLLTASTAVFAQIALLGLAFDVVCDETYENIFVETITKIIQDKN